MAIVANTFLTYDTKGIKEDLTDVIYNISPEETPFMSSIGRASAKQTLHEWQVDSLAAADSANAQLEGDDVASFSAVSPTTRIGNYAQISRKTLILSDTDEVVDKAGRKSEEAYQLAKRSAELKIDMETILIGTNQAAVSGSSAVARKTGSMLAFIKTNDDFGAAGASPVYTTVPNATRTDGTLRAFTEAILKNVIQLCWTEGANPRILSVGAGNKAVVSGFAGVATKTWNMNGAKPATIVAAADVYVSDFGTLSVVPNRRQRNRDGWVLDPDYARVFFLRKFKTVKLAKTGDAEKRMLVVEYGLQVDNEAAHGLAADLS